MPVPGGRLEADVLVRRESGRPQRADQADEQEDRADDHVEAVEAGRHEEVRGIDVAAEKPSKAAAVAVFIGLQDR